MDLDHRQHPYRDDLAAAYLEGHVTAERYLPGERRRMTVGVADLRRHPAPDAPLDSQLLAGEVITVYDQKSGWAWVQNDTDGYVGYLEDGVFEDSLPEPTHSVTALRSFVFPDPDLKCRPLDLLSFSSPVSATDEEPTNGFLPLVGGGWIYAKHLSPVDDLATDYVETALAFLGTPYFWGGRSSVGLDCSALVQLALARAGIACPRDSDQQEATIGEALPVEEPAQRGDLLFSAGHVAIALDAERVVHANAYAMAATIEATGDLAARVKQMDGQGLRTRRRPRL